MYFLSISLYQEEFISFLLRFGFLPKLAEFIQSAVYLAGLLLIAWIVYTIVRKIIRSVVRKIVLRSKTMWDDMLYKKRVFSRLAHIFPTLILYYGAVILKLEIIEQIVRHGSMIYLIIQMYLLLSSVLDVVNDVFIQLPYGKDLNIKSYLQIVKIFAAVFGIIIIYGMLFKREISDILTGLTAMAAVLLLIFKDSILGFTASIQLSANKMVNTGDWITVPKYKADGTVTDINLTTVTVQNWDKTISSLPIYSLVSDSFVNWKGMEESGGRRIKRHINIDTSSIRFCTDSDLERFKKFDLISDYINTKQEEIEKENQKQGLKNVALYRQTNIGVFRRYLESYLKSHPCISNSMTFLVRQLQSTADGLPIEIYVFSNRQEWAVYESIQSDIFDHIFAVLPEFGLQVYQNLSGNDLNKLKSN
ncbi:MAG: mechanosensitive ion channel family protein [Marinifilaceae bacterium]|jgi:miniconductance mechanosensitive channel|nr:mechanosensitive ion channel family protein [Marinifilaceae bacterium]